MAKLKEVELICVTGNNNNKYYKMKENGDDTFTVNYGRVGGKNTTQTYPMSQWNSKYNQKLKKRKDYQYKDITHLRAGTTKSNKFSNESSAKVQSILDDLQTYSGKSVSKNYTISSDAVTKTQINTAQNLVDDLTSLIVPKKRQKLSLSLIGDVNDICTELYTIIPRKMKKVQDFLLNSKTRNTKTLAEEIIVNEQQILDVMAQQVSLSKAKTTKQQTMSSALGIDVVPVLKTEEIMIKKMMGTESKKYKRAFKLINKSTQDRFEKRVKKSYKDTCKLFWHGSRNENWLNIIKTGLLIRPSGVVLTGAMFGNGIYFADKARKSMGYTSVQGSYWARGGSNTGYLALYDVNVGHWLKSSSYSGYGTLNYGNLRKKGYDSFFANSTGGHLYNNEYIVYDKDQCTVKYIIEIA